MEETTDRPTRSTTHGRWGWIIKRPPEFLNPGHDAGSENLRDLRDFFGLKKEVHMQQLCDLSVSSVYTHFEGHLELPGP